MKNKDAFGCTTFRKGNYLGRSYDFYCNDVASSVLHTGRIEGVRYESIGMSGSSFNGMKKDKAIDGSIDETTMNKLFSSIVDGINEKGVAISTLVVPRGDKGITTGTNRGKDAIPAKMVPRIVLDKAYSAKNAVELLSKHNIVQNFGTDYELHWMIADANDTYIVETVNNKLSYLGPEAIEGIESLYNGQLEADVITNFYISGTDFSLGEHTFEMPVDNPTITNYGAGLERFKIVMDSIEDATLSSDKEAMGIINLVQYTNAYKMDNDWYSEFVDPEHDNRSPLVEGAPYTRHEGIDGAFYRVYPIEGATDEDYSEGQVSIYERDEHREGPYSRVGLFNHLGVDYYEDSLSFDFQDAHPEEGKYYIVLMEDSDSVTGYSDVCFGQPVYLGYVFHDYGGDDPEFYFNSFYSLTSKPSEYVNKVTELRTTYNQILSEGGKDAVRKIGLAWHSNHQCVYDIVNKTMLVYPSENGEHAFRVDVHGVVEDEAVEIGGGASVETLPLGGKIFYIDSTDNGATYHFYKEDGSEIKGWTDVASLSDAVSYSVEGEPTADKFYVYYPTKFDSLPWGYSNTLIGTETAIGTGKTNTNAVMSRTDIPSPSIWSKLSEVRASSGIDDLFVPSKDEIDKFREADLEPWHRKSGGSRLRASSEYSFSKAWLWNYDDQYWEHNKLFPASVFFARAF